MTPARPKAPLYFQIMTQVAVWRGQIKAFLIALPFWPEMERLSLIVSGPVKSIARGTLVHFPLLRRAEWLLEIETLTVRHPVALAFSICYTAYLGLMPSGLGHIGEHVTLYPFLGVVSGFNPFLGVLCGVAYGIADIAQKLVYNDIYGAQGGRFTLNYWGAMLGYVLAYSSTMIMGLLPGFTSRLSRYAMRIALRTLLFRRAAANADGAQPPFHFDFRDAKLKAAVQQLQQDPRNLLADPNAWRSVEGLTPYQKLLLAQLRGQGLLGPDSSSRLNQLWGPGDPTQAFEPPPDAVNTGDVDPVFPPVPPPDVTGLPSYAPPPGNHDGLSQGLEMLAGAVGGMVGGALTMYAIAPHTESPAFYLRPNPDDGCHTLEVKTYLQGNAPAGGLGGAIGGLGPDITPPGGFPPQSPAEIQSLIDRWKAINPNSLVGHPALQQELQGIMDSYNQTGHFDGAALANVEKQVGVADSQYQHQWDAGTQAAVAQSQQLQQQSQPNPQDALWTQYNQLIDSFSTGDHATAATMGMIDDWRSKVVKNGQIDPAALLQMQQALLAARQGDLQTASNLAVAASNSADTALNVAKGIRDVGFAAGATVATGGLGAMAGPGLLTNAAIGGGVNAVTGGVSSWQDGNGFWHGAAVGGVKGFGMGVAGGVAGSALQAGGLGQTATNVAVGAGFGAGEAWANGGNVGWGALVGGLQGGVGGQVGHEAGGLVNQAGWGATPPPTVGYPEPSPGASTPSKWGSPESGQWGQSAPPVPKPGTSIGEPGSSSNWGSAPPEPSGTPPSTAPPEPAGTAWGNGETPSSGTTGSGSEPPFDPTKRVPEGTPAVPRDPASSEPGFDPTKRVPEGTPAVPRDPASTEPGFDPTKRVPEGTPAVPRDPASAEPGFDPTKRVPEGTPAVPRDPASSEPGFDPTKRVPEGTPAVPRDPASTEPGFDPTKRVPEGTPAVPRDPASTEPGFDPTKRVPEGTPAVPRDPASAEPGFDPTKRVPEGTPAVPRDPASSEPGFDPTKRVPEGTPAVPRDPASTEPGFDPTKRVPEGTPAVPRDPASTEPGFDPTKRVPEGTPAVPRDPASTEPGFDPTKRVPEGTPAVPRDPASSEPGFDPTKRVPEGTPAVPRDPASTEPGFDPTKRVPEGTPAVPRDPNSTEPGFDPTKRVPEGTPAVPRDPASTEPGFDPTKRVPEGTPAVPRDPAATEPGFDPTKRVPEGTPAVPRDPASTQPGFDPSKRVPEGTPAVPRDPASTEPGFDPTKRVPEGTPAVPRDPASSEPGFDPTKRVPEGTPAVPRDPASTEPGFDPTKRVPEGTPAVPRDPNSTEPGFDPTKRVPEGTPAVPRDPASTQPGFDPSKRVPEGTPAVPRDPASTEPGFDPTKRVPEGTPAVPRDPASTEPGFDPTKRVPEGTPAVPRDPAATEPGFDPTKRVPEGTPAVPRDPAPSDSHPASQPPAEPSRGTTPDPSGGAISPADQAQINDYSKLSADQLKSMQDMARASGNNHEADLIGKALQSKGVPPEIPGNQGPVPGVRGQAPGSPAESGPKVQMPWGEDVHGGDSSSGSSSSSSSSSAATAEPPAVNNGPVHPNDLPPPGENPTHDQMDHLEDPGRYSNDDLLAAQRAAQARGDAQTAKILENALAARGYKAPVDPTDVTPPPPGELPDFTQVKNLADKYSFDQLSQMRQDALARGDSKAADMIGNAINQKTSQDPWGSSQWIARTNQAAAKPAPPVPPPPGDSSQLPPDYGGLDDHHSSGSASSSSSDSNSSAGVPAGAGAKNPTANVRGQVPGSGTGVVPRPVPPAGSDGGSDSNLPPDAGGTKNPTVNVRGGNAGSGTGVVPRPDPPAPPDGGSSSQPATTPGTPEPGTGGTPEAGHGDVTLGGKPRPSDPTQPAPDSSSHSTDPPPEPPEPATPAERAKAANERDLLEHQQGSFPKGSPEWNDLQRQIDQKQAIVDQGKTELKPQDGYDHGAGTSAEASNRNARLTATVEDKSGNQVPQSGVDNADVKPDVGQVVVERDKGGKIVSAEFGEGWTDGQKAKYLQDRWNDLSPGSKPGFQKLIDKVTNRGKPSD